MLGKVAFQNYPGDIKGKKLQNKVKMKPNYSTLAITNKGPPIDVNESLNNISESKEQHSKAVRKTVSRLKLKALQEARHGLYIPLTPQTVEKKWRTKERIHKVCCTFPIWMYARHS